MASFAIFTSHGCICPSKRPQYPLEIFSARVKSFREPFRTWDWLDAGLFSIDEVSAFVPYSLSSKFPQSHQEPNSRVQNTKRTNFFWRNPFFCINYAAFMSILEIIFF